MRRRRLNSSSALTTPSRLVLAFVKRMASFSTFSGISTVVFMLLSQAILASKSTYCGILTMALRLESSKHSGPRTGQVVAHGHEQHYRQPENRGDNDQLRAL